jgi:hypothetical protein
MIELIEDLEKARIHECAMHAQAEFRSSIRPIYAADRLTGRPGHIGSCVLLDIDGTPIVSTAAHLIDEVKHTELFIAGTVGTKLVRIVGGRIKTTPDRGGVRRQFDHFDCAFWRPTDYAVQALGAVEFIKAPRISHNRSAVEGRLYTAIGYPISRNKNRVDHLSGQLSTGISMYTTGVETMPKLATALGVSGNEHYFMRFGKHAFAADGEHMNTFGPGGLSGGALLDLGDFSSPEIYAPGARRQPLLSGMLIEHSKPHRALVAVKIGPIVNGARLALARR